MKEVARTKNSAYIFLGLVFAFATLNPNMSNATTYYVAKTGNDSNPGTESSPFRNIKHGVSSLSAGDTLYVKAGTYNESILSWKTPIPNGTSWDNPVTIAANPGDIVTINPPAGHAFFWVKDGKAKYLIIDGFIVDGNNRAYHGFKFDDDTRYIRVQNSEIKNTADNPILVTICSGCPNPESAPHDTYHEFIKLKVHDSGYNASGLPQHGMYINTGHNLLESSEIYNNSGYGVHFYHSKINSANANIIRNNTFHDNNTAGKWGCGLLLSSGKKNVAYNNVFYGNFAGLCAGYRATNAMVYNNIAYKNDHYGIYIGQSSTGTLAPNNSVYNNGGYGIFVGDGSRDAVVQNNIAYKNKTADVYVEPGDQTGTTSSHNLTSDPKFVNALTNDFHLTLDSLAVDSGLMITQILTDYDGVKRTEGTNPDIGAYEFLQKFDKTPPEAPVSVILVK